MNCRVGETHGETRGWGAIVSPRRQQRRRTDITRPGTRRSVRAGRRHIASVVWRSLEARHVIEMGRRIVPPPPPTNRPQMRESGRERPPSPTRETGFRAIAEGRSRPDSEPRLCRTTWPSTQSGSWSDRAARRGLPSRRFSALAVGSILGNNGSEGTVHDTDQASHSRKAIDPTSNASRSRDERDPVRVCPLHRRADRIRAQPGDRYRPGERQGCRADLTSGVVRPATRRQETRRPSAV